MHRHLAAHAHPDGAELAVGAAVVGEHPHAARPSTRPRLDPELAAGADHHLLEAADVGDHVDRRREADDRVADELSGTVPGDLAAPVDVDDRRPVATGRSWGSVRLPAV